MLYSHHRSSPESHPKKLYFRLLLPTLLLCWLALPAKASAQGLELAGGWTHITGNQGTDGFNFGAGWNFTNKVLIAADYDTAWNNSRIGTFEVTSIGAVTSKSHLQNWMFGPRVFFGSGEVHRRTIRFFGEAQFGLSHLKSTISSPTFSDVSTSDTAFSWMLGGGADYVIGPHWTARGKLDLLRTHFASAGQSRLRLGIGVAYTFGTRER
ncbi:MAG TPA: outer membrane beta-barrel protein [Candidatus Acidoferrum sp.]